MKLLLVGWSRCGKDTAAMYLSKISGVPYGGSLSWAGLPHMSAVLRQHPLQAWSERHENRGLWKRELDNLRVREGQTHLARLALASGDIVTGLRDRIELLAAREEKIFDKIVWIERAGVPRDYTVTFSPSEADECLLNDGSLSEYHETLQNWANRNGLI